MCVAKGFQDFGRNVVGNNLIRARRSKLLPPPRVGEDNAE